MSIGYPQDRCGQGARGTSAFRTRLRFGLLLVWALALLSACAKPFGPLPSPDPPTATPGPPTATIAPIAPATPVVRATLAPEPTPQPGALRLWTTERDEGLELLRTLADEFAKQAGFAITVVPKTSDGLRIGMIAATLTDDPRPDLIWGDQDDLAGLLADGQLQAFGPADAASAFIPALVTNASSLGQIWGQPIATKDGLLLFYNRSLLAQSPTTTDELIVQSRAARREDRYGLVQGWTEARWLLAWLNGFGGAPTSADGLQPTLNTPQMLNALNLLRELWVAAPPDQRSYADGNGRFGAGKVALAIDGDWALAGYRSISPTLDLGIAPLPRVPATGRLAAPVLGGSYLMFQRDLKDAELDQARSFAAFLAEPEVQLRIALALKRLPALRSLLADAQISADPALAAAAAQAEAAIGLPPTRVMRCALRAISAQLPELLAGNIDQQQAAEGMQLRADQCATR